MTWDTVVIGSGPGGLTAAVALARAGQRVLVLEQHYLPGGWTHSFTLGGYRFSPGVHYIGDLEPGGGVRRIFEGLGLADDLQFLELNPEGFDHFLIAGERFDQPKGQDRWIQRLHARFPHERQGIERYFATLGAVVRDLQKCDAGLSWSHILTFPVRAPSLLRWGFRTLAALLDACITDPMLKAVLSAQSGNHGLAPSRVSLPVHAAMSAHYNSGGFYPRGGAKSIPRAFIRELRRRNGVIRLRARVSRILVEQGTAVGVEIEGGETFRARNVVCNADPALVYGKLLAPSLCRPEVRQAKRMVYSAGLLSVFCAVDMDLPRMGFDSGNYWYYRTKDVEGAYARMERQMPDRQLEVLFLTATTLKDPGKRPHGHHTLEMFTFLPYEPFARWQSSRRDLRSSEYLTLKNQLGHAVLETAEQVIPGIRQHVQFLEIGTPLTSNYFCETYRGASYGTAKTPWQVGPFSFSRSGPVRGLHFCGASTLSHGVGAASISGLFAARDVLGKKTVDDLLGPPTDSLRIYPCDRPVEWLDRAPEQQEPGASALAAE